MKKLILVLIAIGIAGAGLYIHAMNKDEVITFALERAQNEFQATDEQQAQIRSLLEMETDLTDDKVEEIIISIVFSDDSGDAAHAQGDNQWFYEGDLIQYLTRPDRTIKPVKDSVYGYLFPLGSFATVNPLTHLVSFHQIYGTCGYHALANAHAVQRLVNEGNKNIRFEDVKRYAQEIFKNLFVAKYSPQLDACKRAASEEQGELLQIADGEQVAVTSDVHGTTGADETGTMTWLKLPDSNERVRIFAPANFFVLRSSEYLANLELAAREQFIFSLMHNKATHFLLLRYGHFTMLSVVKDGDIYHMYYLNSTNSPEIGEMDQGFITQIDALITQAQKRLRARAGAAGGTAGTASEGAASAAAEQARQEELRRQREQEARDEEIARKLAQEQAPTGGGAAGAAGAADPYAGMSERDKRIAQRRAQRAGAVDISKIHANIDEFIKKRGI